jgi:tetratricopeptide (TPR) repeat protein
MSDRAVGIYDRATVHDHAYHAAMLRQAAIFAGMLGQDAKPRIERAFEIAKHLTPDDPLWGDLYTTRGIMRVRAGALDDAEADLREALARWAKLPGNRGRRISNAESRLAGIALRRGRLRDARAALDRARTADPEHPVYVLHEAEYARASRGDPQKPIAALLEAFPAPPYSDVRLAAHVFAVAGDRARALATLRGAGVRETALDEDCITCSR